MAFHSLAEVRGEGAASSPPLGTYERLGACHSYTLELGVGHGAWQQLQQHVVDGKPVMPGSGYMSWALQVLQEHGSGASLKDVRFLRVLDLSKPRTVTLTLTTEPSFSDDGVQPRGAEANTMRGTIQITCEGRVHAAMAFECANGPPAAASAAAAAPTPSHGLPDTAHAVNAPYTLFREQGFEYGPDFAQLRDVTIHAAEIAQTRAFAKATLSGPPGGTTCPLCAGSLDSALQLASFADCAAAFGVPTHVGQLTWVRPREAVRSVSACPASGGGFDLTLFGADGGEVAQVRGMAMVALQATAPISMNSSVLRLAAAPLDTSALDGAIVDVQLDGASPISLLARIREEARQQPSLVRLQDPCGAAAAIAGGVLEMGLAVIDGEGRELRGARTKNQS